MLFHRAALTLGITFGLVSAAEAHVEYYDLNQGKQIADLTVQGKTASTTQYGSNPTVAGLPSLNTASDRPLNNSALWNSTYQSTTTVGTFTGISYTNSHSTATVTVGDVTDFGWGDGTHGTLGDSHKVDFFNFRLAVKSTVSISWVVDDGAGSYLDSAFSLYRGVLAYQGHDASLDPLNPVALSPPPPHKVQDPLDTGTVADAQGIASAFRNTAPGAPTYVGQFNALANWGQANGAGNWSNIAFIQAVNAKHNADGFSAAKSAMLESLLIELLPGNYTIAASGALGAVGYGANPGSFGLTNLRGVLTYSANAVIVPPPAPVPLPASHLLLASGALWLARRRSSASRRSA